MRIAVTSEYHFIRAADGVYTDASYPYEFWATLREVFDEIVLVGRSRDVSERIGKRVDGPGLRFERVPDFVGVRGLASSAGAVTRSVVSAVWASDVTLLRAPGVMATAGYLAARAMRRPYAIEVVGDPAESLPAADRRLAPLGRVGGEMLRLQVNGAVATRFVTEEALQSRYPPRPGAFTIAASDVELPDEIFATPIPATTSAEVLEIVFVGSLARSYKGLDVLLAALGATRHPHRATIVGDGVRRAALERMAATQGLGSRVRFVGAVPANAVAGFLRAADLFVLPSRTEGMPRAMIEAMAVGLPCLATPVGGVPELLPAEAQFAVDDVRGLATAIDRLAADAATRARMAESNRRRVSSFRQSERRARLFYRAVRSAAKT